LPTLETLLKIFKLYFLSFFLLSIGFSNSSTVSLPELGRTNDPRLKSDISNIKLFYKKVLWKSLSFLGARNVASIAYPKSIAFMNSDNSVAITIDDGFCGLDNPLGDMTEDIRLLLKRYNAKATFFIAGTHCSHTSENAIKKLLADGHELANHSMYDIPYADLPIDYFEDDLMKTKDILDKYTVNLSKWYRAPHASITNQMHDVIKKHNLTHVIGDVFANDTSIPDPKWIANLILKTVQPGSIVILHMPERGVREWTYESLELVLKGLQEKKIKMLNLTELEKDSKLIDLN
jgi:peptidoglycan/xylan/chitin deacetylase (PgdA/CDA1 family)